MKPVAVTSILRVCCCPYSWAGFMRYLTLLAKIRIPFKQKFTALYLKVHNLQHNLEPVSNPENLACQRFTLSSSSFEIHLDETVKIKIILDYQIIMQTRNLYIETSN